MCSFLFTNRKSNNLNQVNFLIQKRGPDHTNTMEEDGFTYLHNLLSITGNFTPQPLINENVFLLFNGEIYNYEELGNYNNDSKCIIDLYQEDYVESFKKLDGEFAIVIHDKNKKEIILVSDTFGTKPLYFSIEENQIGVCSYPKSLELMGFKNQKRMNPNSILVIDETSLLIKEEKILYNFNLEQKDNTYEFWVNSFIESVSKRVNTDLDILVPLSSGYDSGLITCILNEINRDYISCTIMGAENYDIIYERLNSNKNNRKEIIQKINSKEIQEVKKSFLSEVHPFFYGAKPDDVFINGFDDVGAIGLYYLLKKMKDQYGVKILLSGHGSDEIMSNIQAYGFRTSNPSFFDENLENIFPYGNFYYGSMWSYLMKEECIAGSLGIETRYPFLDRKLVQSYLNLISNLKNKKYKSPVDFLFSKLNYPFSTGKIGFQI